MKKLMFILLNITSAFVFADTNADIVQQYIPREHKILFLSEKDVSGDGLVDILLVTESIENPKEGRIFQILKKTSKSYQVFLNSGIIPCKQCGGPSEEPTLRALKSYKNGFHLQIFYGGIKNSFIKNFDFIYSAKNHNWFLNEYSSEKIDNIEIGKKPIPKHKQFSGYKKSRRFDLINKYY
ncbi:MAG: hypothetical protein Q4A84_09040 [Neisseria sp.]|uniref:hypothetical protein n=1 Tax=Neisseria sp. TaxID=192066 RepID=UPI0026DAA4B3|nr:hypothetical protein [Neisseria sp.]MDO4641822.1 hypothetical protein [Neisseria sp.]